MQTIVDTIRSVDGDMYGFESWRECMRQYYLDGLSTQEVNKLGIINDTIAPLFIDPSVKQFIPPNKEIIPYDWCIHLMIA